MKLSDPLGLAEARKIGTRLYVEMTRRSWREEWTSRTASKIAKLFTDTWDDPETTDEGRWNMFLNCMAAFHKFEVDRLRQRRPENHEDDLDV